ncbi:hypothetical protein SLA2020_040390 [Shorea laevis]
MFSGKLKTINGLRKGRSGTRAGITFMQFVYIKQNQQNKPRKGVGSSSYKIHQLLPPILVVLKRVSRPSGQTVT